MSQDVRKSSSSSSTIRSNERGERLNEPPPPQHPRSQDRRPSQPRSYPHRSQGRFNEHQQQRPQRPQQQRQQYERRDDHQHRNAPPPASGEPSRPAQPQEPPQEDRSLQPDEQLVRELCELGFSDMDARDALLINENDCNAAAGWLLLQQQQRMAPAPKRPPRSSPAAGAAAAPRLKFKLGTSVSVFEPSSMPPPQAPAAAQPASSEAKSEPSWLEQQALQQARLKPVVVVVAPPPQPAEPAAPPPPLPPGLLPLSQRLQQQEAENQTAATLRTKQYLMKEQLARTESDGAGGLVSLGEDASSATLSDRQLFAQSKRELYANLFGYERPGSVTDSSNTNGNDGGRGSAWLRLVVSDPSRALAVLTASDSGEAGAEAGAERGGFTDQELLATDTQGWNAMHHCCRMGHVKLLKALLALQRRTDTGGATAALAPSTTAESDAALSSPPSDSPSASESDSAGSDSESSSAAAATASAVAAAPRPAPRPHVRYLFDPQSLTSSRSSCVHLCCRGASDRRRDNGDNDNGDDAKDNGEGDDAFDPERDHHRCLELLLRRRVLLNVKDAQGNRPLHLSAAGGDVVALEMLLDASTSTRRVVKNKQGQNPLHLAAMFGHLRVVQTLHKHHRDLVHAKDKAHNLPLHLALGFDDVVHFMLRNDNSAANLCIDGDSNNGGSSGGGGGGASGSSAMVNAVNSSQQCALTLSLSLPRALCESSLRLLLACDASTNPHGLGLPGSSSGLSHGEVLVPLGGHLDLAKVVNFQIRTRHTLLRKKAAALRAGVASGAGAGRGGSTRNRKVLQLTTPLHEAALLGLDGAASILLSHGAVVDAPSHPHRSTPLHYACRAGHANMVTLLLRQGADRTTLNALGASALMFAARGGHHRVVEQLLSASSFPSSSTGAGATSFGVLESLRNHVDPRGETALSLALGGGHVLTVLSLVRAQAALVNSRTIEVLDQRIREESNRAWGSVSGGGTGAGSTTGIRKGLKELLCGDPSSFATAAAAPPPPFADVILRCADNRPLYAHQCILGARSEVLLGLLHQKSRQTRDGGQTMMELSMPHVPQEIMFLVLQFLYRGLLPRSVSQDTLVQLMLLANELLLPRLLNLCVQVAASSGYLSANALLSQADAPSPSSSSSSRSQQHQPVMATLAQLQSLLAPHMHVYIQAHAMQQANRALRAVDGVEDGPRKVPEETAVLSEDHSLESSGSDEEEEDSSLPGRGWPLVTASPSPEDLRVEDCVPEPLHQFDQDLLSLLARARNIMCDVILVPACNDSSKTAESSAVRGLEDDDEDEGGAALDSSSTRVFPAHRCILSLSSSALERLCAQSEQQQQNARSSSSSSPLRVRTSLSSSELDVLLGCIYGQSLCMSRGSSSSPAPSRTLQSVRAHMNLVREWIDPTAEAAAFFKQQLVALLPEMIAQGMPEEDEEEQERKDEMEERGANGERVAQDDLAFGRAIFRRSAASAPSFAASSESVASSQLFVAYSRTSTLLGLLRCSLEVAGFESLYFRVAKEVLVSWNDICVPIANTGPGLALKQHMQRMHPINRLEAGSAASSSSSSSPHGESDDRTFPHAHVCLMLQLLDWRQVDGHSDVCRAVCPCVCA